MVGSRRYGQQNETRSMSFRTRLTSFFVLIVVVPMAAVGVLVFRLINDSQAGKADARANGIASTALSLYTSESRQASYDARTVARDLARTPSSQLRARASALASKAGLERVTMTVGSKRAFDIGDRTAIAPGVAWSGRRPAGRPRQSRSPS
jgi:hypothetical protein